MAKQHKDWDKIGIHWDGTLDHPDAGNQNQNIPATIQLGPWGNTLKPYKWNDIYFLIEIADGIGTGNRRAREARLQQLDKDKKKRLIRLICRVKGEPTAYDETKHVGDIQLKLDDVDMIIGEITKLNVSGMRDWNEVPWNYEYDK